MQGRRRLFGGGWTWINTKCVQRILNKMIAGHRCLAGSEGSPAACVGKGTELAASRKRSIVDAQALVFGICPTFPEGRPDEG